MSASLDAIEELLTGLEWLEDDGTATRGPTGAAPPPATSPGRDDTVTMR